MKKLPLLFALLVLGVQATFSQTIDETEPTVSGATLKVKVFPNPATNAVSLLGLENCNRANIIISDIYGTILLSHEWEIRNNSLTVPIANLEEGVYVIDIRSQEQHFNAKFYKQ